MASKPVTLTVKPRGKRIPKLPTQTSIYIQGTGADLYQRLANEAKFSIHRMRITKEDGTLVPNNKDATIDSLGLKEGSVVQVKDLGLQIAWQTVFVIEYLGPMLIHPLFYFLRPYIYKGAAGVPPSELQTLSCIMITLHFLKRELETLFVHRFSNATMPAFNIFKNSGHYWLLSGFLIAYFTYGPDSPTAGAVIPALTYPAVALYAFGELANLNAHLVLRGLRSPGGTERGIPRGFGFGWVTCPNYFFETLAWLGIWLVNRSWATGVFAVVAVAQMYVWAVKKEKRYRRELPGKYKKKRAVMFPLIA